MPFHSVKKSVACLLVGTCLLWVPTMPLAAETGVEENSAHRINIAGRQRMLTQRLARNACFVMAGIEPERYGPETQNVAELFDRSLRALHYGDHEMELRREASAVVIAQLGEVESLWNVLGAAALQLAAGDLQSIPMQQMIDLNTVTLQAMQQAVQVIEREYRSDDGNADLLRTVNIAGRQRMLSQKMSKEICFYLLGVERGGSAEDVEKTQQLFDTSLTALLEGAPDENILPPPNAEIEQQLQQVSKDWEEFQQILQQLRNDPDPSVSDKVELANISDRILKEMNQAVQLYTR